MTDAQKGFFCKACDWTDFGRYPLWKQLPPSCPCPNAAPRRSPSLQSARITHHYPQRSAPGFAGY
jgi:hypothetical protein